MEEEFYLIKKLPRVSRYHPFGFPLIALKPTASLDGKIVPIHQQLQRGARGVFCGFPDTQAGWKVLTANGMVVSQDVYFDSRFLSAIGLTKIPFSGAEPEREFHLSGKGRPASNKKVVEQTGDISNFPDATVSHWKEPKNFIQQPTSLKDLDVNKLAPPSRQLLRRSPRLIEQASIAQTDLRLSDISMAFTDLEIKEEEFCQAFEAIEEATKDIPIEPYLPEPRSYKDILKLPENLKKEWLAALKKEVLSIINTGTLDPKAEFIEGKDEVVPLMAIFKAKITSRGFLDKLKGRVCLKGDLQKQVDDENTWSPYVFGRTFKVFVATAVKL